MAPPQWAYQVENFVSKPDDELVCSVCHSVFCDPVMCPCDHVFCRMCITKWLQNNRNCPICRKRVPRYSIKQIVPIVKNLIMKLVLACRNKEHGCEAQFTVEGCETHVKECSYEPVQCKNKPCTEKLFRKDIEEHEKNGCPHRYVKCKVCSLKMPSSSDPKSHECIKALQFVLRRKTNLIKKKNERIRTLKSEIKALKETSAGSRDSITSQSTVSSRSPDFMINFADLDSLSSLTSDSDDSSENSIIAIIANAPLDRSSDVNGESFASYADDNEFSVEYPRTESPLDLSEYRNAEAQTIDDDPPYEGRSESLDRDENVANNNNAAEGRENAPEEREERSQQRRPAKRRLPPPILSTSDDDNNELEERPSLPSPKRCWRLPSEEDIQFNIIGDGDDSSSNSGMEAGPSSKCTSVESRRDKSSNTKWHFRSKAQRHAKEETARKLTSASRSAPQGGNAVFERTLALLEQYNLESDPEWLPEYASHRGDTTESESCSDIEEMGDSSSSLSDSDYFNDDSNAASDLLHGLYDNSTSEDDPDWRPANLVE